MKFRRALLFIVCLLVAPFFNFLVGQGLLINEFMSRNETTLSDSEGDFPDWIEIYNSLDDAVNMLGYGLSDDPLLPGKWNFPDVTISPKGYLLVYASGKEISGSAELHANFKIDGDGEDLLLTDHSGVVFDMVGPVQLEPDQGYGRLPDGSDQWTLALEPTPGSANVEWNQLTSSHPGGFHLQAFNLSLYSTNGDTIRFSRNGTEPGPESEIYEESLVVANISGFPGSLALVPSTPPQSVINYKAWESPKNPVDRIQVIRYASFRENRRTSDLYTASYIVDVGIMDRYTMPVISLVMDPQNLIREDSGIYVPGVHFDNTDPQWTGNYFQSGREWEKPAHVEFFDPAGNPGFAQDAGVRIHGMMTRQATQKTLRLYARESYGKKEFLYPLLPQRTTRAYKRILLRSSMCSWRGNTVFSDELTQEIARGLDMENQEYKPVVLYLNGEYWGIQTLRDRIDERYLAYLSGEDKDSLDLINGNYSLVDAGSNQSYKELAQYIQENDLSVDEHYRQVADQVDLSSLIDYMITEIFFSNRDWPGNNQKCWRPKASGGKWRWILFDLDAGFGKPDEDLLRQFTSAGEDLPWENTNTGNYLFRNLLQNQEFEHLFTSRFVELLSNEFSPDITTAKLQVVKEMYQDELPYHIDRWAYPQSLSAWNNDLYDEIVSFLQKRPAYISEQLYEHFNVEPEIDYPPDPELSEMLLVVPNPNNGIFGILNNSEQAFSGRAFMTSTDGKIVAMEEQIFIQSNEQVELAYSHLGSGIYFLYLVNELQVERIRVLILH